MTNVKRPAAQQPPDSEVAVRAYAEAFENYARSHSEEALYRASLLSQTFVEQGLGPEEIIALHSEAFDVVCEECSDREKVRLGGDASQFLLEVMIAYGVQHAWYLDLMLRERTRRAEEAEASDRRRGESLALVAHKLRTPLTAALGSLNLVRRRLARGDVEEVPRLLDSAEETLQRLLRLTADLVAASQGHQPDVERKPLELVVVIHQACTWASAVASEKGIDLRRETDGLSGRVLGDKDALLSIFGNLLSTALRYTSKGGQVTVRYGVTEEYAWAEVADTGLGMTLDEQAHICDRFHRGSHAQQVEQQGLGLGLYLVQRLVEPHEGRITVTSAPGAGSTFRVSLPLMRSGEPAERDMEIGQGANTYE